MTTEITKGKIRTTVRSIDQPYTIADDANPPAEIDWETARDEVLARAEEDFGTAPRNYALRRRGKGFYEVEAQYREYAYDPLTPLTVGDGPRYTFNYRQEPETFLYAFNSSTVTPSNAPTWGGLLGVSGSTLTHRIEARGITVNPRITDTAKFVISATADWTLAYRSLVRSMMGKVNEHPFIGEPKGCYRFVAARGDYQSDTEFLLVLGFDFREYKELKAVGAGSLNIPAHEGHQYAWTYDELEIDDPGGREAVLVSKPKYSYVETLHDYADLNRLFI